MPPHLESGAWESFYSNASRGKRRLERTPSHCQQPLPYAGLGGELTRRVLPPATAALEGSWEVLEINPTIREVPMRITRHLVNLTAICAVLLFLSSTLTAGGAKSIGPARPSVSDDVVVDSGLVWTRRDNDADIDWLSAKRYCEGLKLGGPSSWRLPTIGELEGIYDQNIPTGKWSFRNRELDIHTIEGFRLTTPHIWSDTKEDTGSAWLFYFSHGRRALSLLGASYHFRALCVRPSGDTPGLTVN